MSTIEFTSRAGREVEVEVEVKGGGGGLKIGE
jgi:hypothetical protein